MTFDDAITELSKKKRDISSCFGKLSEESAQKIEKSITDENIYQFIISLFADA